MCGAWTGRASEVSRFGAVMAHLLLRRNSTTSALAQLTLTSTTSALALIHAH